MFVFEGRERRWRWERRKCRVSFVVNCKQQQGDPWPCNLFMQDSHSVSLCNSRAKRDDSGNGCVTTYNIIMLRCPAGRSQPDLDFTCVSSMQTIILRQTTKSYGEWSGLVWEGRARRGLKHYVGSLWWPDWMMRCIELERSAVLGNYREFETVQRDLLLFDLLVDGNITICE